MSNTPEKRKNFGVALRDARARAMLGLREFCREAELDPALVSRIERGLAPPPTDSQTLRQFAKGLGLSVNDPEWKSLVDLASLSKGEIPKDLLKDRELAAKLPVLFRALRDVKSDKKLLDELLRVLRKS